MKPANLSFRLEHVHLAAPIGRRRKVRGTPPVRGRMNRRRASEVSRVGVLGLALLAAWASVTAVQAMDQPPLDYQRQAEIAPTDEVIGEGYVTPEVQHPRPRSVAWHVADVVLLGLALGLGAWLALRRRSRAGLLGLTAVSVAYFGFWREGCVCPIGSIQNVAVALTEPAYAIPYTVIAIFMLPLLAALFFGRVFCGGRCRCPPASTVLWAS